MSAHIAPLRGTPARLVKALARVIGASGTVPLFPMLVVEAVTTRAWSSATFDGECHRLDLRLHGSVDEICAAVDRLTDDLPEHEFDLPGLIVAEARLASVAIDPDPGAVALALVVEITTVVD